MSFNVPTILIGLGGIGSQIANSIYGSIPHDRRGKVAIHAFDTDVNSISLLEHMKQKVTQTSSNHSVGEYLLSNEQLYQWFPNNQHLKRKSLTNGAGQVRAVSRLAFRSAMGEGKLSAMWDGIENIFPVDSDKNQYSVRVIIITSLVGGTGSGIFLQVALYLREMLERKLGSSNVLIRGAFLLPDILVRSNTLNRTQWEAIQANGYASLKELNAITLSASGNVKQNVTIELEYRPNQVDLEGRTAHAITEKHLPYDFCFLYDYENTKGQHLANVSDYLDQVTRSIYLQLFSPIAAKSFSEEDNQIRKLVESEGTARYCGAGAASLLYPYEEIVEYCALNWSVNGLDDSWLLFDRLFNEDKKRYELDLRNGINSEKPELRKRFVTYFSSYANDSEKPNPFFKQLNLQVHELLEKGKKGALKSELFIDAIEDYIKDVINDDHELKEFEDECYIDEGALKVKDQAKKEVGRIESALEDFSSEINKKVNEYTQFIVHQIIDSDYHAANGSEGHSHRLNTWMLSKDSPLHPVAVRFMLYSIHNELIARIASLKEENKRMKTQIERYEDAFELNRVSGENDDPLRRIEKALNQGLVSRMFRNQFKDFIQEYKEKAGRQLRTLNKYKISMLSEMVLSSVNQSIKGLIEDWERFFNNLSETRDTLLSEITQAGMKFEGVSDPTKQFVLASKEMLDQTWEKLRQTVDHGFLPHTISSKIYLSLYKSFIERKNNRVHDEFFKEMKVEAFYKSNVLAHCRKELMKKHQDKLNLNIIQALRLEAHRLGEDDDSYIQRKLRSLYELGQPFVPMTNSYNELKFWGIHAESHQMLTEQMQSELFEEKQIVDSAFKRNEIVFYRSHYGLSVSDFAKFSSGKKTGMPGVYYEAYHSLISRLNEDENRTITPHLDRRWHLPAYMPDLNPEQAELETHRTDRALIIGFIYGWIQLVDSDGSRVYQYRGNEGTKLLLKSGEKVYEEIYRVHEALPHNPVIYDEILERFAETQLQQVRNAVAIKDHDFVKGALDVSKVRKKEGIKNILDVVLTYDQDLVTDDSLKVKANRLRQCLLNEIVEYFRKAFRPDSAKREAAKFIHQLWNESFIRYETNPYSEEYQSWKNDIDNKLQQLTTEKVSL